MKKAADNESEELISSDVSNYLEIMINKTELLLKDFDEIIEEYNSVIEGQ